MRARRTFGSREIFGNPVGLALFVGLLAFGTVQLAVAPAPGSSGSAHAEGAPNFSEHVTRIVDGDTFWIISKDERIRVWGLDAPEQETAQGPVVATSVIQGDGRSDEAAAAVAYWCDFTREEAEDLVTELRRKGSEQMEASLFRSRQPHLDFAGSTDPDNGGRN